MDGWGYAPQAVGPGVRRCCCPHVLSLMGASPCWPGVAAAMTAPAVAGSPSPDQVYAQLCSEGDQLTPQATRITEDRPLRIRCRLCFPCWSQSDLALSPTSCPGLLVLLGQAHGRTQSCMNCLTRSQVAEHLIATF